MSHPTAPSALRPSLPRRRRFLTQDLLWGGVAVCLFFGASPLAAEPWQALGPEGGSITCLALAPSQPTQAWVGGDGGVFRSQDGGATWVSAAVPLAGLAPTAFAIDPADANRIFVATDGGAFRSTDGGVTFVEAGLVGEALSDLQVEGGVVRAAGPNGAFTSVDDGANWSPLAGGLPANDGFTIWGRTSAGTLFLGTDAGEVYRSSDGTTWANASTGLPGSSAITDIVFDPADPNRGWVATEADLVYRTVDGGDHWASSSEGLVAGPVFDLALETRPGYFEIYAASDALPGALFLSLDDGNSWTTTEAGLEGAVIVRVAVPESGAGAKLAGSEGLGLFSMPDPQSNTWQPSNQGLRLAMVNSLAVVGPTAPRLFAGVDGEGVYHSTDGVTWTLGNTGLGSLRLTDLVVDPADGLRAWAAADRGGVYATQDGGLTWAATALPDPDALALERDGTGVLYAGTDGAGVFRSTNDGASWTASSSGLGSLRVKALSLDPTRPNRIFAFTQNGLYRSLDSGAAWVASGNGLAAATVHAVAFDPAQQTRLWAATDAGLFRSLDGGLNWSAVGGLADPLTLAVYFDGVKNQLWLGMESGEVLRSSDFGVSFTRQDAGVTGPAAAVFTTNSAGDLYLGTGQGVFRRFQTQFDDSFESGDTSAWSVSVGL